MNNKKCSKCNTIQPTTNFSKHASERDGLQRWCKLCWSKYRRQPLSKTRHATYCQRYYSSSKGQTNHKKHDSIYRQQYPEKCKAHRTVAHAIIAGRLSKGTVCEQCGSSQHIESHHPDYSAPLRVVWLCRPCHRCVHLGQRQPEPIGGR